ncbi:hypothetical protein YC2023_114185 [Brassica napus]
MMLKCLLIANIYENSYRLSVMKIIREKYYSYDFRKECQSIVATELDQYQKGVSYMQREVVVKLGCHRESSVNMENLQRLLRFQQSDEPVLVTVCELELGKLTVFIYSNILLVLQYKRIFVLSFTSHEEMPMLVYIMVKYAAIACGDAEALKFNHGVPSLQSVQPGE